MITDVRTSSPGDIRARQESLRNQFQLVRAHTQRIGATLEVEDFVIQSMPRCQSTSLASGSHNMVLRDFPSEAIR